MAAAKAIKWGTGVRLLTEHPCGLLAVEKPEGIRSHPNSPTADQKSLVVWSYESDRECYRGPDGDELYLLNRLDAPTSGVVLLAHDVGVAQVVKDLFAAHRVEKRYVAVIKGLLTPQPQVWRDRHRILRKGGVARAVLGSGVPCVSNVKRLRTGAGSPPLSLVELRPETGRMHQLRVQCATRRTPILGDATYGDFHLNRVVARRLGCKRLFLHAAETSLGFEWHRQLVSFHAESPVPEVFFKALGA